jgi:hypothetical protein
MYVYQGYWPIIFLCIPNINFLEKEKELGGHMKFMTVGSQVTL